MRIVGSVVGVIGLLLATGSARAQDAGAATPVAVEAIGTTVPEPPPENRLSILVAGPGTGVFVAGEWLLIRPARQGLDLGFMAPDAATPHVGRMDSLSWDFTSGFRVGAGYRLPTDGWELGTYVTYFHARDNRQVYAGPGGSLFPAMSQSTGPVGSADGDNDLSYGILDFEGARSLSISNALGLRLFGGARLARIDQSFKVIYAGGSLGAASDYVQNPVRFLGAGLTGGGELTWQVYRGLGIYGRGRVSLLAGRFTDPLTETLGGATVVSVADQVDAFVPVGELSAGVSYSGRRFSFAVGYDMTDWLNMSNGLTVPNAAAGVPSRRRSDLTLEGLSLRAGFVF